jgi:hypothetical protein
MPRLVLEPPLQLHREQRRHRHVGRVEWEPFPIDDSWRSCGRFLLSGARMKLDTVIKTKLLGMPYRPSQRRFNQEKNSLFNQLQLS